MQYQSSPFTQGKYDQIMQDKYEVVKASIKDFSDYKNLNTEEKMGFIIVVYHSSTQFNEAFTSYIKNNKNVVETLIDLTM